MTPRTLFLAQVLYRLTWLALIALPAAAVLSVVLTGDIETRVAAAFPHTPISDALPGTLAWAAVALGAVPGAAMLWVLWQCQALFAIYRQSRPLSYAAADRIGRIGIGLAVLAGLSVLVRILQTLVVTSYNAPGQRVLAVEFGSSDLGFALAGGLMALIGAAMAEAARIAKDHEGFV